MRITIDIDEKDVAKIQKETGIKKKSPAIRKAAISYIEAAERRRFVEKVMEGQSDYGMTNEEVEALGDYDSD